MNRLFILMSLVIIMIVPQAWGATNNPQFPNPYRQTMWNNFTDGIHTMGQTPYQAKVTKMRLHNARTRTRVHSINVARHQAWLNSK